MGEFTRLLYRRQFIIGTREILLPNFRSWSLGSGFILSAHNDLPVAQARANGAIVTLLGHVLDPDRAEADNGMIAASLVSMTFPACLNGLGGRWIIAVHDSRGLCIYPDPAGTLQAYYGFGWVASQPDLIARQCALAPDSRALDYLQKAVGTDRQFWWPGCRTLYHGIKLLWPNHCLSLDNGTAQRFWPTRQIAPLELEEAAQKAAGLLRRIVLAARARFSLLLPLTAGHDSRAILAACRGVDIQTYTFLFWQVTARHADVRIARRMARTLGLTHRMLPCPSEMSDEFHLLFALTFPDGRPGLAPIYERLQELPHGALHLHGTVSEIGRCFYGRREATDAESLAALHGVKTSFAVEAFQEWLDDLGRAPYRVLDLFYWENRVGSWAGRAYTDLSLVMDVFSPYNCRELLTSLLATDVTARSGPDYPLHRRIIQILWPELLLFPINPKPRSVFASANRLTKPLIGAALKRVRSYVPISLRRWLKGARNQ